MKFSRFAQAAACIIVLTASNAGDAAVFSRFVSALPDARAEFEYAYRLSSGNTEMSGSGSVIFQGDAFVMKGDGLEVYCDGTDRWTVDRNAREAVAELFDRDNINHNLRFNKRNIEDAAHDKVQEVLATYKVEPLPRNQEKALRELITKADSEYRLSKRF